MWPVIAILCFKILEKRLKEKLEDIRKGEGKKNDRRGQGWKKKKIEGNE